MTKRKLTEEEATRASLATSKKLKDEAWAYKRERAEKLLRDGELTITEIGKLVGMNHTDLAKMRRDLGA